MPRLNQIIAIVKGKKAEAMAAITKACHLCHKPDLFAGFKKIYEPKDEDGDRYPGDDKRLQLRAEEVTADAAKALEALFEAVEIQDRTNCEARADVIVNGKVVLKSVPPTYLLFLEHQLKDLGALLVLLPTLDPAKTWAYSPDGRCYRTDPAAKTKTKKLSRFKTVAEATEHHPAQVVETFEDVVEGEWITTEFSGAMAEERKHLLIVRLRALREAVMLAREEANSNQAVVSSQPGKQIFEYLLSKNTP